MIATIYLIIFVLAVMAITYPEEFPTMIRNPNELLDGISLELKRRWLLLSIGTRLFIEKQRLRFSLWMMRDIIEAERQKQKQQEETTID